MTETGQHVGGISGILRRAANIVLSLAAVLVLVVIATSPAQARAYKVLHRFHGTADGEYPVGGLAQDAAGNLYGVAGWGGGKGCSGGGCGTLFKLDATGKFTVLHRFSGDADGAYPDSLIRDQAGNLYGVAGFGGGKGCFDGQGCGTVFKLEVSGKFTVLHRFTGGDGAMPQSLMRDQAGNLYGETGNGGSGRCYYQTYKIGCGTVFKLNATGKETVLYSFRGSPDGGSPSGDVILDATGNLYGTTLLDGVYGYGIVFELGMRKETVLYSFSDGTDGGQPNGLIRDTAGNLYGTTYTGGNIPCDPISNGCGTVFEFDTTGKETVLYRFLGWPYTDGELPLAPLIMDNVGNLYGTTFQGGVFSGGTVFELTKAGKETVLHSFEGSDGASPQFDSLIWDQDGNLHGTTPVGGGTSCFGGSGCGVIFELTP
jgi:uncharacterized repeat protein (TIGR03803 family)